MSLRPRFRKQPVSPAVFEISVSNSYTSLDLSSCAKSLNSSTSEVNNSLLRTGEGPAGPGRFL